MDIVKPHGTFIRKVETMKKKTIMKLRSQFIQTHYYKSGKTWSGKRYL